MNLMRTSRSLLLCMAVMAVSFMSCDDTTDTIGTSLIDNMDKLSVFADTFNVASRTIESGPVVARNTIGYLGKVKDPETGATVTANYMVQFHTLEGFTLPTEDNIISRKDGEIVAGSSNSVTIDNDPTAHAEVNTIREACRKLRTFDLSGCTIYTSCEPCPMCLGAIYWARIGKIFYGNTRKDARDIQFADDFIYEELERPLSERTVPIVPLLRAEALHTFRLWTEKTDKTEY